MAKCQIAGCNNPQGDMGRTDHYIVCKAHWRLCVPRQLKEKVWAVAKRLRGMPQLSREDDEEWRTVSKAVIRCIEDAE